MAELFSEVQFWHWIALGVALAALEIVVPGAIVIWIGVGAIITGLVKLILPGLGLEYQLLIFAVVSFVSIILSLRFLRDHKEFAGENDPNRPGRGMIGHELTLEEPITNGQGRAKVGDSMWRIAGDDYMRGTRVRIVAIEGTTLRVERIQ
jgi:membrane protein implicated in regulation of membrane protease activity